MWFLVEDSDCSGGRNYACGIAELTLPATAMALGED